MNDTQKISVARDLAVKNAECSSRSLRDTKDKAQAAATWAMSIIHVSLLKIVIDRGDTARYYIPGILLISLAILLQVTAGVISLVVTGIDSYYKSFEDYLPEEGGCCVKKRMRKYNIDDVIEKGDGGEMNLFELARQIDQLEAVDANHNEPGCLGGSSTGRVAPSLEERFIRWYELWRILMSSSEIRNAGASEEVRAMKANIQLQEQELALLTRQLEKAEKHEDHSAFPGDHEALERKERMEESIETMRERRMMKKKKLKRDEEYESYLRKQGDVLQDYVEAVTKERVYKTSARWQNVINYILYAVFILNALIVGLGMAEACPPCAEQP